MRNTERFLRKYYPFALAVQGKTGISAAAILTQCAVETGWGRTVVGNMMFGIKDTDGVNGNEQLLTTTEILNNPNAKFPLVRSITRIGRNLWRYVVKDYFRKYDSPYDSFLDYAVFISKNSRYRKAWSVRHNSEEYLKEIALAGYATAPNYAEICLQVLRIINEIIAKIEEKQLKK